MKTLSEEQFIEYMAEALPDLIASVMRADDGIISNGQITVPQFWALHYITKEEGLTVLGLANRLHRSKSSTSELLSRLEKNGLIKRIRNTKDKRVVQIFLTRKGQQLRKLQDKNRKKGISQTYATLTPEERNSHLKMVQKIVKGVQKIQPDPKNG